MSGNLKIFEMTGNALLGIGVVCTAYGMVVSGADRYIVVGLLIVGFAVYWRSNAKALKAEIEALSVMGNEFASALNDGRDLKSATARGMAKLGHLRTELPQEDFRDPIESVQISYSEFVTAEESVLQLQKGSANKTYPLESVGFEAEGQNRQLVPFTYIEVDSSLYGPDGSFLKQVYCPKAYHWNQLIADDPEGRSRGCAYCSKTVVNLDVVDPSEVVQTLKRDPKQCVFGTEKSVRFLPDPNRPPSPKVSKGTVPVVIHTARTVLDINRGASSGYWPDVRLVTYEIEKLGGPFSVVQNTKTGLVEIDSDPRFGWADEVKFKRVIDFTDSYQYYQKMPVAAYLVPKKLPTGTPVLVLDPIEDILGETYGQVANRAKNISGVWDGEKIILDISSVKVRHFLG